MELGNEAGNGRENMGLEFQRPPEKNDLGMEIAEIREKLARVRNELGHSATKLGSIEIVISEGGRPNEERMERTEEIAAQAETETLRLIAEEKKLMSALKDLEEKNEGAKPAQYPPLGKAA